MRVDESESQKRHYGAVMSVKVIVRNRIIRWINLIYRLLFKFTQLDEIMVKIKFNRLFNQKLKF